MRCSVKVVLLLFLLCNFTFSEEFKKITGEFGVELSKALPKNIKVVKSPGITKETKYKLIQDKKSIYTDVLIYTHPDSRKVYSIIAFKKFDNELDALEFRKLLLKRTQRVYGKNITDGATVQGDKMVQVTYLKSHRAVIYGFVDIPLRRDAYK